MPRPVSSPSMGLAPWSRSVLFRRRRILLNGLRERGGGERGGEGMLESLVEFLAMKGAGTS